MKPKQFYPLVIIVHTSLVIARTYPNYGYYNPFPPKNQVLYSFSPVSENGYGNSLYSSEENELFKTKHSRRKHNKNTYNTIVDSTKKRPKTKSGKDREARDLTWRQFDVFLRGDAEPSCSELRQMWNLARKLQSQSSKEDRKESKNHHFMFHHHNSNKNSQFKTHNSISASDSDIDSVAITDKKLAPTNQVNHKNNSGDSSYQFNLDKNSKLDAPRSQSEYNSTSSHNLNDTSDSSLSTSTEEVYGVVKTHHIPLSTPSTPATTSSSPNARFKTFRVRDPAKELFGMFRQRSKSLRNRHRKQPQQHKTRKYHYGTPRLEAPNNHKSKPSYLDLLQRKLYGPVQNKVDEEPTYGTIHKYPSSAAGSYSSYNKVRDLLAGQRESNGYKDDCELSPGETAFDCIRKKLLNTRAQEKMNMPKSYLRRLRSRKRRQNVSIYKVEMILISIVSK